MMLMWFTCFTCFTCSLAVHAVHRRPTIQDGLAPIVMKSSPSGDDSDYVRILKRHLNLTSAIDKLTMAKTVQETHPAEPLQIALVSSAQLCIFDNFLHYFRLRQLVAFNFDRESLAFCQQRSAALASRFMLHCAEPVECVKGTGCRLLADNHFLSPEYIRLTWVKPVLIQLALELGAASVLVMDIDNLQVKDFLRELEAPEEDARKIQVPREPYRPLDEYWINTGLMYVTRQCQECMARWLGAWETALSCVSRCEEKHGPGRMCHCWTDQEGLQAQPQECVRVLDNEVFFTQLVDGPVSEKALTVHPVGPTSKPVAFKSAGLWHPDVLTDADCSYAMGHDK